jgi:hypothetical protein
VNRLAPSYDRLVAVLGMMGSEHDGEALAAARMAERMRRAMGLTWAELLSGAEAMPEAPVEAEGWRATVARCQAAGGLLNAWERQFLVVLAGYSATPSARQLHKLAAIASKVAR